MRTGSTSENTCLFGTLLLYMVTAILPVFLVENYPKHCEKLPDNLLEVQHRTRDIMFSDKTIHNIQMSKAITYYLRLINDLYKMLEDQKKRRIKISLKSSAQDIRKYQKNIEQKLKAYIIYPGASHFHLFTRMQIFR
jgi:NTE family protein